MKFVHAFQMHTHSTIQPMYMCIHTHTVHTVTSNYFATAGICRSTSSQLDRAAMMLHSACM